MSQEIGSKEGLVSLQRRFNSGEERDQVGIMRKQSGNGKIERKIQIKSGRREGRRLGRKKDVRSSGRNRSVVGRRVDCRKLD